MSLAQVRALLNEAAAEERRQNQRWLYLLRASQAHEDGFQQALKVFC